MQVCGRVLATLHVTFRWQCDIVFEEHLHLLSQEPVSWIKILEFPRITQSWHFCVASNQNIVDLQIGN